VQAAELPEIVSHIKGGEPSRRLTERANPQVRELILKMLDRYVERAASARGAVD
jgi:hypothetical protein